VVKLAKILHSCTWVFDTMIEERFRCILPTLEG
jgi:hypothetical protein